MTELEVCNWALVKLGEPPITSLKEGGSTHASHCKALLQPLHLSLLRRFEWSFAVSSTVLTPLTEASEGRWVYPLPKNCLRILIPTNPVVEGRFLTFDEKKALPFTFIRAVPIPESDSLYCEALACKLAVELCMRVREAEGLKAFCIREFDLAWHNATLASCKEYQGGIVTYG